MNHLDALELRLSHERERLRSAQSESEKKLRANWILQIEKEISQEREFIGQGEGLANLSDDDLLAALAG